MSEHRTVLQRINDADYKLMLEERIALYDMLNQFAYRAKDGRGEYLYDGGLSALENAFVTLNYQKGKVYIGTLLKHWNATHKELDAHNLIYQEGR